jgi:hypothetical protein
MILIGFILVGAAVALGVDVAMENSDARLSVVAFGHTFSQPPWVVLVVGAICGALVLIGLGAMGAGTARRRRLWREHRGAIRERDRLAVQLEHLRANRQRAEPQQRPSAMDEPVSRVPALSGPRGYDTPAPADLAAVGADHPDAPGH